MENILYCVEAGGDGEGEGEGEGEGDVEEDGDGVEGEVTTDTVVVEVVECANEVDDTVVDA